MNMEDLMWRMHTLKGFDLEHVGFNCWGEIELDDPDPRCPFKPGCGLPLKDCPLRRQQAMVGHAPRRPQ